VRQLCQTQHSGLFVSLPDNSDAGKPGTWIKLDPHRLNIAAATLLETNSERIATMYDRLPPLQQQLRPLFRARHQGLFTLIQNETNVTLTGLMTRRWRGTPLANVAPQHCANARFVTIPSVVYGISFKRSGLRKHSDVGLELLRQRSFPFKKLRLVSMGFWSPKARGFSRGDAYSNPTDFTSLAPGRGVG
jgi:hypothetical protein